MNRLRIGGSMSFSGSVATSDIKELLAARFGTTNPGFATLDSVLVSDDRYPFLNFRNLPRRPSELATAMSESGLTAVALATPSNFPGSDAIRSADCLSAAGVSASGLRTGPSTDQELQKITVADRTVGILSFSFITPHNARSEIEGSGAEFIEVETLYHSEPRTVCIPGTPPTITTIPNDYLLGRMNTQIQRAKNECDFLLITMYWGLPKQVLPADYQHVAGRAAIDSGADIVVGTGPETWQPIESYRQKYILHGLGRLIRVKRSKTYASQPSLVADLDPRNGQVILRAPAGSSAQDSEALIHSVAKASLAWGANIRNADHPDAGEVYEYRYIEPTSAKIGGDSATVQE